MTKDELLKIALNIYCFGSYVYNTYSVKSDKDYIVIVPDEYNLPHQIHLDNEDYNIYTRTDWLKKCNNNDIECLEVSFLDPKFIIKETEDFKLVLNYELIRKNISKTASNSFVKCKKKLTIEEDYNERIAKKSLWHSIRLLMFGIQLMNTNKIYNYEQANQYYNEIVNSDNNDWNYFKEKYQSLYNSLKTEFKLSHKHTERM